MLDYKNTSFTEDEYSIDGHFHWMCGNARRDRGEK